MSNYSQIKGIIDAAVYENHQQAITGDAMNAVLNGMVSQLGAHYRYEGYASPSTDPGTPDENVFYLATEQGAYPNFGNLSLTKPLGVFKWDGSWTLDQIAIDTGTAAGLLEKVNANTAAINAINAKIPPEASTDNKLADKAYVDRAVATNTGTFVGTFGSVSELPTDDVKANDYAYVVEDGVFKRYKYNGSEWLYEYSLDNTAFSDYVKAVNITAQGIVFDFAAGTDKTFLIASGGGLSYTGNGLEITSLKSSLVISALGYTPFDASQFTAQNIISTLGNNPVKEALHALTADTAMVANKVAHPLYFYDADSDAPRTYDGSAVVSVTIPSAAQIALWDKICSLFDIDGNGDVYVTGERGFFSNSFLSARGTDAESGGGGGLDVSAMWSALAAGTSEQINLSHLPSIPTSKISGLDAASVGYATSAGTADRVEYNLTVKNDGGVSGASDKVYNGSSAVTINIPTALPASDVYDWAKQPTKPSYTFAEIGGKPTTLAGYGITDGVNSATASGNLTAKVTGHSLAIGVASSYEIPSMTRTALWDKICALFDVDSNGDVYVTGNRGFYSNAFVSARGSDSEAGQGGSGGLDIDAMWDALATSGSQKIDASHIPALGLLSGTVSNAQLANSSITVAGVEVPLGSEVTTAQIATALTGAGYKLTDTTYGLATDTAAGLVKTGYLTQVGTKNYGVKLNSLGQMYVSVPWTDTVTTLASLGITATAAEINKLDGLATTATELGYVHGVTSNIQTQLNAKANASALSAYLPLAGGVMTGDIEMSGAGSTSLFIRMYADTSNYRTGIGWKTVSGGTLLSQIGYWNTEQRIYINSRTNEISDIWQDAVGKYSLVVGKNLLTYNTYPLLHSGNYTSYTVSKTGDGASGTWGINISGNASAAGALTNNSTTEVSNRLRYHQISNNLSSVGSTAAGGAWGTPLESQDSIYGNGQILRLGWAQEYYTDIFTGPNGMGSNYGIQFRQVVSSVAQGWRVLLDTSNYATLIGNVKSATKLATVRTLWGQSFDGTGNVNGHIFLDAQSNRIFFGTSGTTAYISAADGIFSLNRATNTSYAAGLLNVVLSSGNVGIGTTAPSYKLHVAGEIYATSNVRAVGAFITDWNNNYTFSNSNILNYNYGRFQSGNFTVSANNTCQPVLAWCNQVASYGYRTRYSIASVRTSAWGSMRLSVGNTDAGDSVGAYIDINGSGEITLSGTVHATVGIWSSGWLSFSDLSSTSDRRFKDGITPLDRRDALSVIHALKPSTWTWNALSKVKGRSAGFVAQDVADVLPDAIREIGEDKHLALNYQMLHAYEVAALQEHDDEIARLRKRVDFLENELKRARSWRH